MLTKIYYEDFVYLYHDEMKLQSIVRFLEENVLKEKNFLLKWKSGDDMIVILRQEDLNDAIQEQCQNFQQFYKLFVVKSENPKTQLFSRILHGSSRICPSNEDLFSFRNIELDKKVSSRNFEYDQNIAIEKQVSFDVQSKELFQKCESLFKLQSVKLQDQQNLDTNKYEGLVEQVSKKVEEFLDILENSSPLISPKNYYINTEIIQRSRSIHKSIQNKWINDNQLLDGLQNEKEIQVQDSLRFSQHGDEENNEIGDKPLMEVRSQLSNQPIVQGELKSEKSLTDEVMDILPPPPHLVLMRSKSQTPQFQQTSLFRSNQIRLENYGRAIFKKRQKQVVDVFYCDICSEKIEYPLFNCSECNIEICLTCIQQKEHELHQEYLQKLDEQLSLSSFR